MSQEHLRLHPDKPAQPTRQDNETAQARGKLKIFLGYVSGVGKTYAMLEAAHQRLAEGVDLVVAYLDTHGQAETEIMQQGLEILPRQQIEHRDSILTEMNIDQVLIRRPQLALVDDLAHTNALGSRHARRYQDVLELLDAGIGVYTTLNIQHLESLKDIVAQITGVTVQETVPDRLLDEAHEIELVDLPLDELLQRLEVGKVHVPEQAARTIRAFFRPGNLSALRELALRRAADRIDEQMRAYMQTHAIAGPWAARERVLVCVSPSPLSERLVRTARRLAARLNAEWFAVYVETPGHARMSQASRDRIAYNLQLAESLGAKTLTLSGQSVAEAVVDFARTHNIATMMVGKPLRPRWWELLKGTVFDRIIRESRDLDIYVISNASPTQSLDLPRRFAGRSPWQWQRYVQSAALVAMATLLGFPLRPLIEPTNLVMIYLLVVVMAAIWLGQRPAILASVLSVIAFNYVFVPPYNTYIVADAQFLLTFAALLLVGIVISTLTAQTRDQARAARLREAQTTALYELSRELAAASEPEQVADVLTTHIGRLFACRSAVLLPQQGDLIPCCDHEDLDWDAEEQAAATWALQHRQPAGHATDTLSGVENSYLPLLAAQQSVAVLAVGKARNIDLLMPQQWRLLEAFAQLGAQALRRVQLAAEARQARLLRETEKLQSALLNSISHDLRTPLASITGALSSLRDDAPFLDEAGRMVLVNTAWEQADRLNTLVSNLLQMTRLEAGGMRVNLEANDVQDMIGAALAQLGQRLDERLVKIHIPDALPLIPMDMVLMVQAVVNLVDNAIKYSPDHSIIEICADCIGSEIVLQIIDEGPGVPESEVERIFTKFYRLEHSDDRSGTGLGLSISKGIIEAHHGRIWVENRIGGGAIFSLTIPLAQAGRLKEEQ